MNDIKQKLDKLKDLIARTKGRRDTLLEQIKSEFDCETVEDAEKLLKQWTKEATALETKYEKALNDFNTKYGDKLDALTGA